jgi:hypothetical protein
MKKELKMAIIATIAGVAVISGISIYTVLAEKNPEVVGEEADINISEESTAVISVSEEYFEGDKKLEEERGLITGYVDEKDVLMSKEMMSTRNHILFTEALTNFLNNSGYPSEEIVINPDNIGYEGSVSYFSAGVSGYDDLTLYVESYNTIDAFSFALLRGDTVIASSKEQYKEETEAYEKELENNYKEAASALGTEIILEEEED